MEPLTFLTYIAVILLLGVLLSAFATRLKLPDILFFIVLGLVLGNLDYKGAVLFEFPLMFISTISLLALAMIVFESTSKIKIRSLDTLSLKTLKFVFTFLIINMILFTFATYFVFKINLVLAILFATIMAGTAPSVILPLLGGGGNKVLEILKVEALMNTPLTVLLPFLVLDLHKSLATTRITATFIDLLGPFLAKFVSGIGAGVLVGLILFKIVNKAYSKIYSPLAVVIAALLAYVLAENLGGNGVLAVTALGLFFGNIYIKEKVALMSVETVFAKSLYILVFVLVGSLIKVPLTPEFFMKSGLLFAIYLFIRWMAINFTFRHDRLTGKEKLFMALVCPKGIAVSVVAVVLTGVDLPNISTILDLILVFIIYSIVLSSIMCWLKNYFLPETKKRRSARHS